MNGTLSIFLANVVATLFLTGLIWMVQVVHYPLFDDIGDQNYIRYQQRHQTNITYIVGPVMLIELATAVLMVWYPMDSIGQLSIYLGLGLVVLIWSSTAFIQVPCHEKLVLGFDPAAYQWLVQSNWIRTIAWTVRSVIVISMLIRVLSESTNGSL